MSKAKKAKPDPFWIVVGSYVRHVREERGLSQRKVAAAADLDQGKVSALENGRPIRMPHSVRRIVSVLGYDSLTQFVAEAHAWYVSCHPDEDIPGFLNAPLALTPRRGRAA